MPMIAFPPGAFSIAIYLRFAAARFLGPFFRSDLDCLLHQDLSMRLLGKKFGSDLTAVEEVRLEAA